MAPRFLSSLLLLLSLTLLLVPVHVFAEGGMIVDGAGYTLHDTESIKGHNEQTVEKTLFAIAASDQKSSRWNRMKPSQERP